LREYNVIMLCNHELGCMSQLDQVVHRGHLIVHLLTIDIMNIT